MTNILKKINETGTLLVEALAMLGLVSMVTPVLYKKAAERTTELQDINASSQLRAIATAMDAYLKDNFAAITRGDPDVFGGDFSVFTLTGNVPDDENPKPVVVDVNVLRNYLPYGMMIDNQEMRETKLFSNKFHNHLNENYKIMVRLKRQLDANKEPIVETLTGFLFADPKHSSVDNTRAMRIASMVGSNGAVADKDPNGSGWTVQGTQGIWNIGHSDIAPVEGDIPMLQPNTLVVSSLQPISSQGLTNENVLYRVDMPDDDDQALNAMTTDLFLGTRDTTTRNIRMVNQIVMSPDVNRMVGSGNETDKTHTAGESGLANDQYGDALDNALYITNGGGANVQGRLQAIDRRFSVEKDPTMNNLPKMEMKYASNTLAFFKLGVDELQYGNPSTQAMIFQVSHGGASGIALRYKKNDGIENLYIDQDKLEAMDKTLLVDKTGNEGYVTIGVGGTAVQQHGGPARLYQTTMGNGNVNTTIVENSGEDYRVTVSGSMYVNDTIQGGNVSAYEANAGKFRAGAVIGLQGAGVLSPDGDFFMLTEKTQAGESRFSLYGQGHSAADSLVYASSDSQHPGFTVNASNVGGGIDLIAGNTSIFDKFYFAKTNSEPQYGEIRMGAEKGIYLSTFDDSGQLWNFVDDMPVSIQDTMLQVYNNPHGGATVETDVDRFYALGSPAPNQVNKAQYMIEGMQFDVGKIVYNSDSLGVNTIASNARSQVLGPVGDLKTRSVLNIKPDEYGDPGAGEYGKVTTRFAGGIAVYDHDMQFPGARNNASNSANPAALFIDKGKFEIRATRNLEHSLTKGELIMAVDNNKDDNRYADSDALTYGSVYIRKGSINLATNRDHRLHNKEILEDYNTTGSGPYPTATEAMMGYIAADRFISNYSLLGAGRDQNAINATRAVAKGAGMPVPDAGDLYTKYEVNPAYTSVMHDIKLTTRGGARLSDILPDFINKGIYVVDTSYEERVVTNWTQPDFPIKDFPDAQNQRDIVSAYVGFVPTPKCPQGYAKVITLTPAGWAMAQAGKLTIDTNGKPEVSLPDAMEVYNQNSSTASDAMPIYLDYQKSTWLRSEVRPVYEGHMNHTSNAKDFNGWGLIMGFIYPASQYGDLARSAHAYATQDSYSGAGGTSGHSATNQDKVFWNLFPVYKNEIEGYATVYCYFDRTNVEYDSDYVDKYDQLKTFEQSHDASVVNSYEKTNDYNTRLNDQRLKFRDPW